MSQKSWPRAILHMDMDAFYVNVHILDHPEDAGCRWRLVASQTSAVSLLRPAMKLGRQGCAQPCQ